MEKTGKFKAWLSAFRLRTLPLALASIGMGSFLAAAHGHFKIGVVAWCMLTTLLLQILSNLANDYGDTKHGADSMHRQGPKRAVQAGLITAKQMKQAMVVFTLLSLCSGLMLLWTAFGKDGFNLFLLFLGLGLAAIWAAINYTAGDRPYGYAGLGDLAVFLFFGLVGVGGTYFLQAQALNYYVLWPAASLGFFSMAVLNVNNIRDIESDRLAGKYSLPVRLGPTKARVYHLVLLTSGFLCALVFTLFTHYSKWQFLFLLALPLLWYNGWQVWRIRQSSALDPYLKQMALTTLLFVVSFGIGLLL